MNYFQNSHSLSNDDKHDFMNKIIANNQLFNEKEIKYAKATVLQNRERIYAEACILFKLKDQYDFTTTKDFNKFQKKIFDIYKLSVRSNSKDDITNLDGTRYGGRNVFQDGSTAIVDLLLKENVLTKRSKDTYGRDLTEGSFGIREDVTGNLIKKQHSPRNYSRTDFVHWTIYSGQDLNMGINKRYLTWGIHTDSNMTSIRKNGETIGSIHPQDDLKKKLIEVKESNFVTEVLGEYFDLVGELITDPLNQKGKEIDMFEEIFEEKE